LQLRLEVWKSSRLAPFTRHLQEMGLPFLYGTSLSRSNFKLAFPIWANNHRNQLSSIKRWNHALHNNTTAPINDH
jgi:hypothetical protein